jgi:transcriptional regulator with XRE-family HTH domain
VYAPVATTGRSNSARALAALLRKLREETGMRQVDLAEALGEPQSFVSRFESGERRLDVLELRAVCRALKLSLDEFIRRFEEEVP